MVAAKKEEKVEETAQDVAPEATSAEAQSNKVYVGNLPYSVTSDQLRETFAEYGEIVDAVVIVDKYRNRSKGFGFVEYKDAGSTQKAIDAMNGKEMEGRALVVNMARPQQPRE